MATRDPGPAQRASHSHRDPMRVIFTDADGCLHPDPPRAGFPRLCWLPILTKLIEPHPEVHVVLHSSWRLDMPQDFLRQLFGELGPRYLGVTVGTGRFASIERWLRQHQDGVSAHLILDDMAAEFSSPPPPELILCRGRDGIASIDVQLAIARWLAA